MLHLVSSGARAHLHSVGFIGQTVEMKTPGRMRNVETGLQDAQNVEPKHNVPTSKRVNKVNPEQVCRISGLPCKQRKVFNHQNTAPQNCTGSDYLQSDAAELKQLLKIKLFFFFF